MSCERGPGGGEGMERAGQRTSKSRNKVAVRRGRGRAEGRAGGTYRNAQRCTWAGGLWASGIRACTVSDRGAARLAHLRASRLRAFHTIIRAAHSHKTRASLRALPAGAPARRLPALPALPACCLLAPNETQEKQKNKIEQVKQ